jgi:hypothetical protein
MKGIAMTPWKTPEFEELTMNAEIGAYQEDPGDGRQDPPYVRPPPEAEGTGARIVTPRPVRADEGTPCS